MHRVLSNVRVYFKLLFLKESQKLSKTACFHLGEKFLTAMTLMMLVASSSSEFGANLSQMTIHAAACVVLHCTTALLYTSAAKHASL